MIVRRSTILLLAVCTCGDAHSSSDDHLFEMTLLPPGIEPEN
jgi:hypothetical protein